MILKVQMFLRGAVCLWWRVETSCLSGSR